MGSTTNLILETHDRGVDTNRSFESYRMGLSGPDTDSNMMLIDTWSGTIPILLALLSTNTSACVATYNSYISTSSGCVTTFNSGCATVESRFELIDEFSGSGQADFDSISQDFTHVIVMGTAAVDRGVIIADVGCDFNADSGSSNYRSAEWIRSGSAGGSGSDTETFQSTSHSQVLLGNVSGSVNSGYGGTFFAIIPNYSGSSGFYKAAMGFSMNHYGDWMSAMKAGGFWTSTSPITRIRIFGSDNSATRYNFLTGTKISIYGLL